MRSFIIAMVMVVGLTVSLYSQDLPEGDKANAEKEVKSIVESRVKAIVTPLVLAEKLKMEFPPQAPTEKLVDIEAKVKKDVMAQVDAKYPPSTKNLHLKAAIKKYVLYKKDDEVKDLRIRPVGRKSVISGRYSGVDRKGEHVVGSYPIPKVDMTEDVLVHFDPKLNKQKIEQYVKNKMFYFYDDREKMKKELTPILEEEYHTKAGYYKSEDKYVPANQFLKEYYETEKERVSKELYSQVEAKVFAKYNLESIPEEIGDVTQIVSDSIEAPVDDFSLPDETPEEVKEPTGVRVNTPLFDPSFYDPEF